MTTLEQLPEAPIAHPTDMLLIEQSGVTSSITMAALTAGLQPELTLAPGVLLGRVGAGPGQPQPINTGAGVTMAGGALAADMTVIAPLASPSFTGSPTAPTPAVSDSSNAIATTAFVQQKYFQPVTLTGDVAGSASATNGFVTATLPAITSPGTYSQVTVNAKGQVTAGSTISGAALGGVNLSASMVRATGASQSATLAAHAALQLDAVVDFGADPAGVLDSTAALQAAIAVLEAAGGGRLRLAGQFKISASLIVNASHIALVGLGHGQLHGDLSWTAPSRIVWAGVSGGTMLIVSPIVDTIAGKALINVEISDILFDCESIAAIGVRIASVRHGTFRLGYLNPAVGSTLQAAIVFDTADIAEYNDTQFNTVSIVGAELGSGGQGIVLQAKSRACLAAGSPYFGNVSYNTFKTIDVHYWRGVPLTLRETDNNVFEAWGANAPPSIPAAFPTPAYATANSIEIEGSSDPVWAFPAISNVFVHGGVAGPIMCRGTPSYTLASGAGTPPNPNLFLQLDKGNGVPDPTIEAGAYALFGDLYFIDNGKGLTGATLSDTRVGIETLRAKLASLGSQGGAAFHSSTGAAARFFSSDVSQSWTVDPGTDGGLSLIPTGASYFPLTIGQAGQPELRLNGATNGNPVGVTAYSSGTPNVSMAIASQGGGTIYSATGNGIQFQVTDSGGATANILSVRGATSGNSPALQVYGSDTNVDLTLSGQGHGLVRVGTPPSSDNSTAVATTAWVQSKGYLSASSTGFSIANGVIANAAQPANAVVDVIAPLSGTTYIDNVISLQNNSVNAAGLSGNAAIRFRASTADGGYERGAIGYSAPLNAAFFPHLLYAEIGNIAATTDVNDTDFSIVNTHASGAAHLPGTSYQAFTVQGSTGNISLTGPTGVVTMWNAATGVFSASGLLSPSLGTPLAFGTPEGTVLKINDGGQTALSSLTVTPGNGGTPVIMAVTGEVNQGYSFRSAGSGQINFQSGAGGNSNSLTILPNSSAVNALAITGGSAGSPVLLGVNGSDPNVSISINPQGAGSVVISKIAVNSGFIDNTTIGSNIPAAASFSTIAAPTITAASATGVSLGTSEGTVLQIKDTGVAALSKLVLTPGNGGTPSVLAVSGETNQGLIFRSAGNGQINFQSGAGGNSNSLTVMPNTSAVNALSVTGSSSGAPVVIGVNGSDPNISIDINPQGTGTVYISKMQGAGGTIDNTSIGSGTPSSGVFTTLKSNGLASFSAGLADASYSTQVPVSGFSITVPNGVSTLQLIPAGPLAAGNITMPSTPGNGQWLLVTSTAAVNSCVFSPATGQTILGAPSALPAYVEMSFQYQAGSGRWVCQSGNDARVASVASSAALMFGTGADGAAVISSGTTTLTRDMHYTNLTISGTGVLNPAGWRIFVTGLLDISGAASGAIISNGLSANNASGSSAGGVPGGLSMRTVGQSPSTGGAGGAGSLTTGAAGTAGSSITYGNGGNGGTAGSGGATTSAGGAGGSGGVQTVQIPLNTPTTSFLCPADNASLAAGLVGGGGGGGGGDGSNLGGGGGSGGSYGGTIALYARNINRGTNSTSSIIQAKGSNGGNGGIGAAGNTAGGGGGGGGGGGVIYVITEALLGSAIANALDVSGGAGGTGGNASGSGKGGNGGAGGAGGSVQILNLLTPSFSASVWNSAGVSGATTSTAAGATGGAGAQVKAVL